MAANPADQRVTATRSDTQVADPGESMLSDSDDSAFISISRREFEALKALASSPPRTERRGTPELEDWAEKSLAEKDKRLSEIERVCKIAVKERELATILAGKALVPGAAMQLIKLWRDDLDVYEEDGEFKVSARDGRDARQAVEEWIGSPAYSHFCLASSRGGTGARDANRPVNAAATPTPKNLGEAIVIKWREDAMAQPTSLLKPIGLRRHR